jgi:hypothetical protein
MSPGLHIHEQQYMTGKGKKPSRFWSNVKPSMYKLSSQITLHTSFMHTIYLIHVQKAIKRFIVSETKQALGK